jgi:hypothetical protein
LISLIHAEAFCFFFSPSGLMRHTPSLISHLQVVISFRVYCLTFILLFLLPDSAPSSLAELGWAGLGVMSMNDLRDPPSLDSDMMSPSDDAIPLSGPDPPQPNIPV